MFCFLTARFLSSGKCACADLLNPTRPNRLPKKPVFPAPAPSWLAAGADVFAFDLLSVVLFAF